MEGEKKDDIYLWYFTKLKTNGWRIRVLWVEGRRLNWTYQKVPLFKVSKTLIEDLFTNKLQLDITILPKIRNKAICYFNGETKQIPYLVLLSDGRKCFAIELDNKGNTLYKSSLLLEWRRRSPWNDWRVSRDAYRI